MLVQDVINFLNTKAPFSQAESWDPVGLTLGSLYDSVDRIVLSLDWDAHALALADQTQASCIIVHHPPIFPKDTLDIQHAPLIQAALERKLNIITMHTNYDRAALPSALFTQLELTPEGRFYAPEDSWSLIMVMVPPEDQEVVQNALTAVGAGQIGDYTGCAFRIEGEGAFFAPSISHPTKGAPDQYNTTPEHQLQMVFPRMRQGLIEKVLKDAHPYEEPAYWIVALQQHVACGAHTDGVGYGFYGRTNVSGFFERLATTFDVRHALVTQALKPKETKAWLRCGFTPGKATSFVAAIEKQKCDVFITGEIGYHAAKKLAESGCTVIELGHTQSEKFFFITLSSWLQQLGCEITLNPYHHQTFTSL